MKIVIDRIPFASPRPRFRNAGKFTQTYMPSNYTKEKEIIEHQIRCLLSDSFEVYEGAVTLDATFYMPIPKSLSKVKKEALNGAYHTKKPDRDNLLKTYQDVLEGLFYKNDSQICEGSVKKIYSDNPRVELSLNKI